jgi:excisionase family DNA binding protein
MEIEKLMTTTEAGQKIGLSGRTILYHIEQGNLKAVVTASGYRITDEALSEFKKSKKERGRPRKQSAEPS